MDKQCTTYFTKQSKHVPTAIRVIMEYTYKHKELVITL